MAGLGLVADDAAPRLRRGLWLAAASGHRSHCRWGSDSLSDGEIAALAIEHRPGPYPLLAALPTTARRKKSTCTCSSHTSQRQRVASVVPAALQSLYAAVETFLWLKIVLCPCSSPEESCQRCPCRDC